MRYISTVHPESPTPLAAQVDAPALVGAEPIDHGQTDERIRAAINREREARGLPALEPHPALKAAAERIARDNSERDALDHFGSDGSNWAERCREAGYPGASLATIGEDVAGWQTSPEMAVGDWMTSPGHRAAILGRWQHCGAASATAASGRSYWAVDFGRPE